MRHKSYIGLLCKLQERNCGVHLCKELLFLQFKVNPEGSLPCFGFYSIFIWELNGGKFLSFSLIFWGAPPAGLWNYLSLRTAACLGIFLCLDVYFLDCFSHGIYNLTLKLGQLWNEWCSKNKGC